MKFTLALSPLFGTLAVCQGTPSPQPPKHMLAFEISDFKARFKCSIYDGKFNYRYNETTRDFETTFNIEPLIPQKQPRLRCRAFVHSLPLARESLKMPSLDTTKMEVGLGGCQREHGLHTDEPEATFRTERTKSGLWALQIIQAPKLNIPEIRGFYAFPEEDVISQAVNGTTIEAYVGPTEFEMLTLPMGNVTLPKVEKPFYA